MIIFEFVDLIYSATIGIIVDVSAFTMKISVYRVRKFSRKQPDFIMSAIRLIVEVMFSGIGNTYYSVIVIELSSYFFHG